MLASAESLLSYRDVVNKCWTYKKLIKKPVVFNFEDIP